MKVLVNRYDNTVAYIGAKAIQGENSIALDNGVFVGKDVNILDLEVPTDILPGKHCYSAEKGFYINPMWNLIPSDYLREDFQKLQNENENLKNQLAQTNADMAEFINYITGGNA